jgi:hypothetical protein
MPDQIQSSFDSWNFHYRHCVPTVVMGFVFMDLYIGNKELSFDYKQCLGMFAYVFTHVTEVPLGSNTIRENYNQGSMKYILLYNELFFCIGNYLQNTGLHVLRM